MDRDALRVSSISQAYNPGTSVPIQARPRDNQTLRTRSTHGKGVFAGAWMDRGINPGQNRW